MAILQFIGKYHFLSNFYISPAAYDGMVFPSSEAAYQAAKTLDIDKRRAFLNATPSQAKRMGRKVKIREDWDSIKIHVMRTIVMDKFQRSPDLLKCLLETGDQEIVEGNYWGDKFWGVCDGEGENHLGKILMKIRDDAKS